MKQTLVVVQGSLAVGKTRLSRYLAEALGLGLLAKDDFKELLYDRVGIPEDREVSRAYGTAAMRMMFTAADAVAALGKSFIVESAFHTELAEADIAQLQRTYGLRVVQVYCHADATTLLGRHNERIAQGMRHEGHPRRLDKTVETFMGYEKIYRRLDFPLTVDVDTTDFNQVAYDDICSRVKELMEGHDETGN